MTETFLPRPMVLDEFVPLIGHAFEADCTPQVARLTLIEAKPSRWSIDEARPGFVLLFRSVPEVMLVGAAYVMRSGAFGPVPIYIEPVMVAPGAEPGRYYEAIFN